MAGGMSPGRGPTLAERVAGGPRSVKPDGEHPTSRDRPRLVLTRHCWVTDLPEHPGRWAGLVAEWRQDGSIGGWLGRVIYAVDEGDATVIIEAWVTADHLHPAL